MDRLFFSTACNPSYFRFSSQGSKRVAGRYAFRAQMPLVFTLRFSFPVSSSSSLTFSYFFFSFFLPPCILYVFPFSRFFRTSIFFVFLFSFTIFDIGFGFVQFPSFFLFIPIFDLDFSISRVLFNSEYLFQFYSILSRVLRLVMSCFYPRLRFHSFPRVFLRLSHILLRSLAHILIHLISPLFQFHISFPVSSIIRCVFFFSQFSISFSIEFFPFLPISFAYVVLTSLSFLHLPYYLPFSSRSHISSQRATYFFARCTQFFLDFGSRFCSHRYLDLFVSSVSFFWSSFAATFILYLPGFLASAPLSTVFLFHEHSSFSSALGSPLTRHVSNSRNVVTRE